VDAVINRYYDRTTDQFLSVDPMVSETDESIRRGCARRNRVANVL
jgi:hypothetical protein